MGFVTFTTRSAMNKAIELNGEEHMGRALKVEESLKSGGGDRGGNKSFGKQNGSNNKNNFQSNGNAAIETPTLFIGGLSYQSTSDSISSFFSSIGDVQSARVVTDKETGNVIIFLFSLEDLDTLSSLMQRQPKKPTNNLMDVSLMEEELDQTQQLKETEQTTTSEEILEEIEETLVETVEISEVIKEDSEEENIKIPQLL